MTVLDTSAVVGYLVAEPADPRVGSALRERVAAAPDLLIFEAVAALRRMAGRGELEPGRAEVAVADLGSIRVDLFPCLPLRRRAWELRDNLAAGDAFFAALAERLGEPLITHDRRMAAAVREHVGVETIVLGE